MIPGNHLQFKLENLISVVCYHFFVCDFFLFSALLVSLLKIQVPLLMNNKWILPLNIILCLYINLIYIHV